MKLNRNLAIVALVLLIASVWTYRSGISRADRFQRGQRLLANLNPDDVTEIAITRGDQSVTLKRGDDGFTVADAHDYPATNQAVNRVLRTLMELQLEKKVGTGDDLYRELGLSADSGDAVEVALEGTDGDDMVRLRIGKALEGGDGSYLRRLDGDGGPAYLSTRRVTVSTDADSYLDKEIVRVAQDQIERIQGPDFAIVRGDDGLELDAVPHGRKEKAAEMNRVKNALNGLRFDRVLLADDGELRGLSFHPAFDVRLTDGSGYRLALAERDGEHFLQVSGYHTVDHVTVGRDESQEELEDKAEILGRADEISRFNRFHGSWVYHLGDAAAKTLGLRKADLIETEG